MDEEEINRAVSDALKQHNSIRILGDLPTEKLNSEDYLNSTHETIASFVNIWQKIATLRLLAIEIYPRHTYFALDINNDRYDYDNAHTQMIILPVYLLRLSRESDRWKIFRHLPQDSALARRIAFLHESHGQDPIPFVDDHNKAVIHYAPRNIKTPSVQLDDPSE
ncbi:hypothetical protein N7475_009870 [Penicillium sp. IBT 31633x]|nr:hypothetical protein N7475_009870 [Penicillium sp. IBT 31633x]